MLKGTDLTVAPLFANLSLTLDDGARAGLVGVNGAGKTTLLRLLAGVETPDTGGLEPGHGLRIGYFAQEHDTLDNDATVWQNIRHAAPETGEQDLRGLLGAFMFTGAQLDQAAGTLSGGEKTRDPQRVVLLPDGTEDYWSEEYRDLIELA